jgi:hypothetical protein
MLHVIGTARLWSLSAIVISLEFIIPELVAASPTVYLRVMNHYTPAITNQIPPAKRLYQ